MIDSTQSRQDKVINTFWGDRCGNMVDPDRYTGCQVRTKLNRRQRRKEKMLEMMKQPPAGAATAAPNSGSLPIWLFNKCGFCALAARRQ
ncbi:MAG: hypothetical protein JO249_21165 [Acidobacteria bacterium]|nr:hypothetical protein [Acidobacteriota bacterium]